MQRQETKADPYGMTTKKARARAKAKAKCGDPSATLLTKVP
jgi:hypothetical protein